ncbi:MAG: RIP metalloprotease RseP [Candidatus Aminicenantes bacterium]
MGSLLGTILAFAIVFGILVFVHEFGHFFMAKLVGIRVESFSFGYGKRLFGIKKGGTDYRVSLIPMGGYVKFGGEEALEGIKGGETAKQGDFMAAKRWQRFLVIFMGPVMNLALAVVIMAFINMTGVQVPEYQNKTPEIGWIAPDSPAERSGLQPGDVILSINGKRTETWNDVELAVGTRPEKDLDVQIKRDGRIINVDLTTESRTRYNMGYAGFFGEIKTEVTMVSPGSPAEEAGLKPGDVILAINGEPVYFYRFVEVIEANPGSTLDFLVERDGEEIHLDVTPRKEGEVGKIGIAQAPQTETQQYGFFQSFARSVSENIKLVGLVVDFVRNLIIGEASTRQLGGPIEIASFSYAAMRMGVIALLSWIAFISLQLGIINLVPVPVFDGGQMLVLSLEGLFRKDFSPKVKQVIMQIGFAIFIFLIVFIILNDVVKRLPQGWESLVPW